MKRIADLVQHRLKWVQPSALKMNYELHADDELAATLRFRSSWGSLATAESADGCWTFKRVGFWQTKATIRASGSDQELAVFKNNTWAGGGTLELANSRKYPATSNFWQTQYEFQTEQGTPLIRFKCGGLTHLSSEVDILPSAFAMPELPWMVLFGFYLVVGMTMDAAAAVVVSCG